MPEGTRSGPLGLQGPGAAPPGRPSQRAKCFSGGSLFLCFFLFAIEKERRKPSALYRGRHPGRGAAGLLVTNGGSRLELKSPTGRCQGGARAAHQKHPGGMFLRAPKRACGVSFWLAQGSVLDFTFRLRQAFSPIRRGVRKSRSWGLLSSCTNAIRLSGGDPLSVPTERGERTV